MNYDLTLKQDRRKFIKRANYLLKKQRDNVSLVDESSRTIEQNSYVHVLCRILAEETGVSEWYAKYVYFKQLANPHIFVTVSLDKLTNKTVKYIRSCSDLSIKEMSDAISGFIMWSSEQGYELPQATINDEGKLIFKTDKDEEMFRKARITTSKFDDIRTL